MKAGLVVGVRAQVTVVVTEDMCPAFDDVVIHRVYSTWSLAHHMELAARKVLAPFLEDHEEGIGTHLSIDHVSLTPVGKTVEVVAEVCEVEDDSLVCSIHAYDAGRLVGSGRQIQRVLPKETIERLIRRHK